MTVIVCVDDDMGTMFNCRRQSKDRVLRKRVLDISKDSKLWMSPYTQRQFEEESRNIFVADNYLDVAERDDFCFVEGEDLRSCIDKINCIILYKWNRSYPSDKTLDINLSEWILQRSFEFEGNSHEKITEEVYIKDV